MKLNYFPDTDTLYIDLSGKPSVDSDEVADGVVLDYDASGNVVGMEIEGASRKVQLDRLILSHLPGEVERIG